MRQIIKIRANVSEVAFCFSYEYNIVGFNILQQRIPICPIKIHLNTAIFLISFMPSSFAKFQKTHKTPNERVSKLLGEDKGEEFDKVTTTGVQLLNNPCYFSWLSKVVQDFSIVFIFRIKYLDFSPTYPCKRKRTQF